MTIENPTTTETAELSATAIAEAETLASEATGLFDAELKSERRRALLYRELAAYVLRYSLEAINAHAKKAGYGGEKSKLTYQLAAQFLTGIDIFSATDEQRAERQTIVRPFALMLDALVRRAGEHSELDEADWFAWYRANGQQKGLLDWLRAQGASAANVVAQAPTPDSIVEDAFGSPAAVTLPAEFELPALVPGRPMLVMVRQDESGIRVVPLPNAGSSALASVAGYRATGLENAPPKLRFWHQLMSVGAAIIPDASSDEPVSALEPDDEPNASTPMLPAYATYLWDNGKFSIAGARSHDTPIVEVLPRDDLGLGIDDDAVRFIDKRTRNTMAERLSQPSVCAGYAGEKGISQSPDGSRVRVKFTHTNKKLNGQLSLVPLTEFRTNWTRRVSPEFNSVADALMDVSVVADFRSTFLNLLASKSKADAQVVITISNGKITFKRDKAKSSDFPAMADGSASVRVMQSDLMAVIPSLLMLAPEGGLSWELDPEGLLMVEISTDAAIIRAYVQTLETGRDTRSRKLLERVRAPQQLAPTATDTPALAA